MSVRTDYRSEDRSHVNSATLLDDADYIKVLTVFKSKKISSQIKKELLLISPEKLDSILTLYLQKIDEQDSNQLFKDIENIIKFLPLDQIRKAVAHKYPNQKEALLTAAGMLEKAQYYLKSCEHHVKPSATKHLLSLINGLNAIIDSIFTIFGVTDLLTPTHSPMEVQFKVGRIMMIASLFMILSSTILPLYGIQDGGLIVGGSMITLAVLSIFYKKLRPHSRLPHAINLTDQIRKGMLPPIGGRDDVVKLIAKTLSLGNNAVPCHVMLLGESGVGKTQTIYALAQAIEKSPDPAFAKLKNKKIYYINAADIVNKKDLLTGGNQTIKQISDAMGSGSNRSNKILVFDEIAVVCQSAKDSVADQLKTYLDPQNPDKFPYVIAMTTVEEYKRDIASRNYPLARRFIQLPIENTGPQDTLQILNSFLCRMAPEMLLEPGILQHLIEESHRLISGGVEPGSSLRILSACIKAIKMNKNSQIELEIEKTKAQLKSLYSVGALDPLSDNTSEEVGALKEKLEKLLKKLEKEKKHLAKIKDLQTRILNLKRNTNLQIIKAHKKKGEAQEKIMKMVLINRFFIIPLLEKKLRKLAVKVGAQIEINKDLVKRIIEQELAETAKMRKITEEHKLSAPVAA